jgi:hypothetical protein
MDQLADEVGCPALTGARTDTGAVEKNSFNRKIEYDGSM